MLTATEGGATGQAVAGGKVAFPYFGAAGRPERNRTLGPPLLLKSGFLSLFIPHRDRSFKCCVRNVRVHVDRTGTLPQFSVHSNKAIYSPISWLADLLYHCYPLEYFFVGNTAHVAGLIIGAGAAFLVLRNKDSEFQIEQQKKAE